ncbi:MAG: nucleotidyltransferase family protein [Actinomycetia bacterium]|nr:nucleotidyltransferase family protein [Actinomycetes bacterium]
MAREPTGVSGVVLAAGAASRFGEPKQRILLPQVLERLAAAELDETVVIAGAHELELDAGKRARLVYCTDWDRGPGASLRAGLAALRPEARSAVVCLADGPLLSPAAVARVIDAWRRGIGLLLAASYDGTRDHPVLIDRSLWSAIPDDGGRALPTQLVDCSDLPPPGDINTKHDLARLGTVSAR